MTKTTIMSCLTIDILAIARNAIADAMGPAPNSGDGVSDDPGWEE